MSRIRIYFFVLLVSCLLIQPIKAEETGFDPFPENRGTIYEYSDDNIPDICFFPADKARWNGDEITNEDWNELTDFQKTMFIGEYIELKFGAIEYDGWRVMIALNTFVENYGNNAPVFMVIFLNDLFQEYVIKE